MPRDLECKPHSWSHGDNVTIGVSRMVREGAAVEDELARHFKRIDRNSDGFLNRKELAAGMVAAGIALPSEVFPLLSKKANTFSVPFQVNASLCDWDDSWKQQDVSIGEHRTILGPGPPLTCIS